MPEALVLGNGTTLLGIDPRGRIQDMYFDYVGLEDHILPNSICKIGVWVEGNFKWFEDESWQIDISYKNQTMLGFIKAINHELGVEIQIEDTVHNERNIILRNVLVKNLEEREREIKVYFNHQFRMYGMEKRDTVYYDPADHSIVHYKGRRIALIGARKNETEFLDDFSVGLSNIEGKVGTWKDAEDGALSKNPIEHGTVDSTIGFYETVDSKSSFKIDLWICLAKTQLEVKQLQKLVISKGTKYLTNSSEEYWNAWVNKAETDFGALDKNIIDLYKKSLLIIRTHVDNTGGIIASCDSGMLQYGRDNYSYVWHRDGSFVAMALDKAGQHEASRKFYEFSVDTITEDGYFFHKYRSDKALGSSWHGWVSRDGKPRLPIQEDETALVISALWRHYEHTKDLEFVEKIYNPLIKKASDFLLGFRSKTFLPKPTYDLWEQRWGIHTFTASTVFDGLTSASNFASLLGKNDEQTLYREAATEVRNAILKYMFNEKNNFFYKYVDWEDDKLMHDETVDASSFYGIFKFDVLEMGDERLEKSYKTFEDLLCCKTGIGGVSRYVGDNYYQVSDNAPSNPWIITTLWKAQYLIKKAETKKDLAEPEKILKWVTERTLNNALLPEQVNPFTGEGLSATPLIWSHAEFVTTVLEYLEKRRELK